MPDRTPVGHHRRSGMDALRAQPDQEGPRACLVQEPRLPSLADAKILAFPGRDYGFRLIVPKSVWVEVLSELAQEQTWSNFKTEAAVRKADTGSAYVTKLHAVWWEMLQLQDRTIR